MKRKNVIAKFIGVSIIIFVLSIFLMPELVEARRGGGRSFGGSRSFKPRTTQPVNPQSFGTQRLNKPTSFGGYRISKEQARAKYGIPKKVSQTTQVDGNGMNRTYNIHHYDGYASGLMTGYIMGHTSWLWMLPFHPAFYYTKPYYVENEDGSVDVYPPTLSFGRILLGIIIFATIIWIIYKIYTSLKRRRISQSSFI